MEDYVEEYDEDYAEDYDEDYDEEYDEDFVEDYVEDYDVVVYDGSWFCLKPTYEAPAWDKDEV